MFKFKNGNWKITFQHILWWKFYVSLMEIFVNIKFSFICLYFANLSFFMLSNTLLHKKTTYEYLWCVLNFRRQIEYQALYLKLFYTDPETSNWQAVKTQIRRHRHLIRICTVCKLFSHISLGISKSHSLTYLKTNSILHIYCVGELI